MFTLIYYYAYSINDLLDGHKKNFRLYFTGNTTVLLMFVSLLVTRRKISAEEPTSCSCTQADANMAYLFLG